MAAAKVMGHAARVRLPQPVSKAVVAAYSRAFGVDLDEADSERFASFDAFFTRELRRGVRPVDTDPDTVVSPCDGTVRSFEPVDGETVVRAKGHPYAVEDLLADPALARAFVGGMQTVIYLHPRDYHRVHTPVAATTSRLILVPGRLLPVNDAALEREPGLFALNERMVHVFESEFGLVAAVMVAAFGVGHMSCTYRPVQPHPRAVTALDVEGITLERGAEIGMFHLGSTVILYTQRTLLPVAGLGPIQMGQPLLRRAA